MPLRFSPSRGAGALVLNSLVRGPVGTAATIAAGTTTTLGEGSSATFSNSGTSGAAIFDAGLPRGAIPAVGFNFDTSTTDADPGAGDVRFNNATPASITAIYFDNADRDGNTVTTWLDSFDDSTSTSKGHIVVTPAATPSEKLIFSVSGSVVDGTGYRKVTVAHVAGTVLPSASDHLAFQFSRTGDAGQDGELSGTFGTTANVVPRADGTGGITAKAGLFTNDDSGNIFPNTDDTGALGKATNAWADLFLASGGVINFSNGDVTISHSGNLLSFNLASSGYAFDAAIRPATSDGSAIGSSSVMWSDLFLASGAVINFNNGNLTVTHSAGELAITGIVTLTNSGLHLLDTNASHDLIIKPGSDLSADRILTITTGDAARTLTLNADVTPAGQGKQTIWIPASAMWARTTNGPGAASRELTTGGDVMIKGWAFDTTTEEAAQFYIAFPKSWDKGTITFQAYWTNANGLTTETVSWGLSAGAYTDSDAIDTTDLGTEVRVSDTWLAANDLHVTAESAAVTVGNTPIDDDMVIGQIARSVANDNMTGDAELLGVKIFFTTSAATDA